MHRNEGGMGRRKYGRQCLEFVLNLIEINRVKLIDFLDNSLKEKIQETFIYWE